VRSAILYTAEQSATAAQITKHFVSYFTAVVEVSWIVRCAWAI